MPFQPRRFAGPFLALALLTAAALAAAPFALASAGFEVIAVSVHHGQVVKLNQPIHVSFNQAIDFSTVNLNTVSISTLGGLPAVGEFTLRSPRELIFRPACPTEEDLSDSGLLAGEVYALHLPDANSGAPTVRSTSGAPLSRGARVKFRTPSSTVLDELFQDEVPGPPRILVQPGDVDGSWVSAGDGTETWFQLGGGGIATLPDYFLPLNLYSDGETRVVVNLRFDQSLLPVPSNLTSERVRLEYRQTTGSWAPLATKVSLVENCSGGGATLELVPQGVLPQRRLLRVWVSGELQDLVGENNGMPLDFLRMRTSAFDDDAGNPLLFADEWYERFALGGGGDGSLEDTGALEPYPRAEWGEGRLRATTGFIGTGGPHGEFDLKIRSGTVVIFDTVSTLFIGGPDFSPQYTQLAINGVLHVRRLLVEAGGVLRCQGPNPVTIHATGTVTIEGEILVDGTDAAPVFTLDTPQQPEPGAPGQAGGGSGGVGSYLTTQVTPRGGNGFGAYQVPDLGGEGGEAGWNPSSASAGTLRRAAGGGGGRFGHDQLTASGCRDQAIYGLDVESGFVGQDEASSSYGPHLPYGGHAGPSPLGETPGLDDDFHGLAVLGFEGSDPQLIAGELETPWAGSGGGAGGDATRTDSYPPPNLIPSDNDKGAGGGGGAGAITLNVLGDVVFGPSGRIGAVGGHGSGGENTAYLNRIGGGSGGGSGGHVMLHVAGTIDLSQVPPGFQAIDARGGEGGAGAGNQGGADDQEEPDGRLDARHVGRPTPPRLAASNVDNPWIPTLPQGCIAEAASIPGSGTLRWVVRAAGGDGGPGLIQLHVPELAGAAGSHSIRYPGSGSEVELAEVIRPLPVGYDRIAGEWKDHLLLAFGTTSRSRSKWIALGEPQVAPGSSVPDTLEFLFGAVDPGTGEILTAGDHVLDPPPILSPSSPVEAPGLPDVVGPYVIWFDLTELAASDEVYLRNPELLREYRVIVGTTAHEFASVDIPLLDVLAITVSSDGPPLATSGPASLVPRYFQVETDDLPDYLPGANRIGLEFQTAGIDSHGAPDPSRIWPAPDAWETDLTAFDGYAENSEMRFLRFRVTFELETIQQTSRPVLEFLRMPYRF